MKEHNPEWLRIQVNASILRNIRKENQMRLEIFFDDLIPDTQQRVLELYDIANAEDGNYDVLPLFVLDYIPDDVQ